MKTNKIGINHAQAMIDGMSDTWQKERAETQLTLGGMIDRLESLPPDMLIDGIKLPHSYRGYYDDLAFERSGYRITAKAALSLCRSAMGEVFQGYKGGDFVMGRLTPVWISDYGTTGVKIVSIDDNGTIVTQEDEF